MKNRSLVIIILGDGFAITFLKDAVNRNLVQLPIIQMRTAFDATGSQEKGT